MLVAQVQLLHDTLRYLTRGAVCGPFASQAIIRSPFPPGCHLPDSQEGSSVTCHCLRFQVTVEVF
jgi:hypothetical protein